MIAKIPFPLAQHIAKVFKKVGDTDEVSKLFHVQHGHATPAARISL